LLVWLVTSTDWRQAGNARFAFYGLIVGGLALGRATESMLLVLVLPLAWLRTTPSRRLAAIGTSLAAFAPACLPATVVNARAAHELIPFTYNLGFNLAVGNNPEANGGYVDVTAGSLPVPLEGTSPVSGGALDGRAFILSRTGQRLSPAASSAWWTDQAW